jgi:superfamily II DNA or RNA helicase
MEAPTHDDVAKMKACARRLGRVAPKDRLLIGVTATPNRSDAIGLELRLPDHRLQLRLKEAIADGWLVPPFRGSSRRRGSLDQVRTTAGEFNQKDLAEAVNNAASATSWRWRPGRNTRLGLPTLAFTVDVQHAHDLAAALRLAAFRRERSAARRRATSAGASSPTTRPASRGHHELHGPNGGDRPAAYRAASCTRSRQSPRRSTSR